MTDDLRARLEQLPTGELLAVLRDRDLDEWRPEAFPLVEAILRERHAGRGGGPESLSAAATYVDFEALTEIATFGTSVDAHLCRMALEEAEIPCWVFNDNLAGVHVPLAMAIGVKRACAARGCRRRARDPGSGATPAPPPRPRMIRSHEHSRDGNVRLKVAPQASDDQGDGAVGRMTSTSSSTGISRGRARVRCSRP